MSELLSAIKEVHYDYYVSTGQCRMSDVGCRMSDVGNVGSTLFRREITRVPKRTEFPPEYQESGSPEVGSPEVREVEKTLKKKKQKKSSFLDDILTTRSLYRVVYSKGNT